MYHVELRQFPHNSCRFNLTEGELHEKILNAWARGEWIEFGERKWSPHQANLTVLDGPELPVGQLSMGRGWRNAVRQGRDVTEQLLATARDRSASREAAGAGAGGTSNAHGAADEHQPMERRAASDTAVGLDAQPELRLAADSLGLEVLARLDPEPLPIAMVWELARERYPEWPASDCLKLAERAISSLAEARLVVVLAPEAGGEAKRCSSADQIGHQLLAIDSWSSTPSSAQIVILRA